ncbi:hypothetical protein G7Y89_g7135 [Cudoniella acicularis]|uniref:Rhodopsin domain-containing protein n=1 Tax=Cudoniella acicularis TaxID=354080 RepID=A0A8H4W286_9HELO|nr:hypothetical protein G7Y89_g7135 [Cudoniella acicularis]
MALENRGSELAAVVIVLLVFTLVAVGLRCYTMGVLLKRFFAEDWLSVVTLTFYIAYSAFVLIAVHFGLGAHVDDVPEENRPKVLMYKYLGMVFYVAVAVLVKFVVGILLLRICSHQRWQRITIYTLLGVVAVFNIFYIFIVIFQCVPIEYFWSRWEANPPVTGKCNSTQLAVIPTYISLLLNVVSDFTLALLPVSFVWKSKMEIRTKISVVAVLGLGSLASLATASRIPYTKELLHSTDYTYDFTDLAIWSTVELALGLSASSFATLKPLFRKLKILAVTTRTGTGVKQTGRNSALHSRKLSTMSLPFCSNNFEEIGDEASGGSKNTAWPPTPSDKDDDLEMGIFEDKSRMERHQSTTSLNSPTSEDLDVVERVEHFKFSLRRPQTAHTKTRESVTWEDK